MLNLYKLIRNHFAAYVAGCCSMVVLYGFAMYVHTFLSLFMCIAFFIGWWPLLDWVIFGAKGKDVE